MKSRHLPGLTMLLCNSPSAFMQLKGLICSSMLICAASFCGNDIGTNSSTSFIVGSFNVPALTFTGLEHAQNFPVRAGKGQLAQLGQRTPASIFKRPGRPVGEFNSINIHRDPVASDRVPQLMELCNGEW